MDEFVANGPFANSRCKLGRSLQEVLKGGPALLEVACRGRSGDVLECARRVDDAMSHLVVHAKADLVELESSTGAKKLQGELEARSHCFLDAKGISMVASHDSCPTNDSQGVSIHGRFLVLYGQRRGQVGSLSNVVVPGGN